MIRKPIIWRLAFLVGLDIILLDKLTGGEASDSGIGDYA